MRILILALLGLLYSCSGAPTADTTSPVAKANPTEAAAPATINGFAAADWEAMSNSEQQQALDEIAMLADLAKQGIYPETQPCQVTVKDHRSGVTIGLYNEGYIDQSTYYTKARASASYKVVPNINMGALLKSLEDQGYFEEAMPGLKKVRGAFLSIIVRRGKESWTLSWGQVMGDKNKELAHSCSDSVRVMFDTQLSIQVVHNPDGSNFFEKERNRINNDNAKRLSNGKQ
jgi:hypothetical protein